MEFVPETSLSSGEYANILRLKKKSRVTEADKGKADKGKGIRFDSRSESYSDFDYGGKAVMRLKKTETYRSPTKREYKKTRKNVKIKVTPKRKRSRKNSSSDEVESDGPTKVNVVHKSKAHTFKSKHIAYASRSESDSDSSSDTHPVDMHKTATYRMPSDREYKKTRKNFKIKIETPDRRTFRRNKHSDGSESDGMMNEKKAHKPKSHTSKPQEWDMLMAGVRFFASKIDSYNAESTILELKTVLTEKQQQIFKFTCFGDFLDLKNFKLQSQIVHNLLFREVAQSKKDELWVNFNEKILRFGLEEFAVVTGLKCVGLCNKASIQRIRGGLYDKYFACFDSLTRQVIHHRFKMGNFEDDEDAVKVASLHLLVNFLMGGPMSNMVDPAYVHLLDTDASNDYPWGKEIYQFTIQSLKGQCYGKEHFAVDNYNKRKGRFIYYRLRGFIMSLQFWFYEICGRSNGITCLSQGESQIPRMIKWRCIGDHKTKDIRSNFFSLPHSQFNNITPTEDECSILRLDGFFKYPNQFIRKNDIPSSSRGDRHSVLGDRLDEVSIKQSTLTSDLAEIKVMFKDFSAEVINRLGAIQAAIDQGVCNANISINNTQVVDDRSVKDKKVEEVAEQVVCNATNPQTKTDVVYQRRDKGKRVVEVTNNNLHTAHAPLIDNIDYDPIENIPTQLFDELVRSATKQIQNSNPNRTENHVQQTHPGGSGHVGTSSARQDYIQCSMPSFDAITAGIDDIITPGLKQHPRILDASAKAAASTKTNHPKLRKKRDGSCPLDVNFWTIEDQIKAQDFDYWLEQGTLAHPRRTPSGVVYYKARCGYIKPPFDFNVAQISTKAWFRTLDTPGNYLEDTHVDVLFYYIRKLAFYSDEGVHTPYTTTDVMFHQTISSLYEMYALNPDPNAINVLSPIVDYLFGYMMKCGTTWLEVDEVLLPIHVTNSQVKWVLGILSLQAGNIFIFNSVSDPQVVSSVEEAVKPYSILIPLFLDIVGFYKSRKDINVKQSYYKGKKITDPFTVIIADNLPVPESGDCGLHMVWYAEHYLYDNDIKAIDVAVARKRLVYLLWAHATEKQDDGHASEEESPGPLPIDLRAKFSTCPT